jgi:hypothetical protein
MTAIGLLFVRMLCDYFKPRQQLEAEVLVQSPSMIADERLCAIAASNHALAGDGAKFKSSSFLVVAPAAEAAD